VGLFTVELEMGQETRAMIERIAADTRTMVERVVTTGAVEVEVGPQTREVLAHFFESRGDISVREKIGGVVGKATGG
jgi:hypothetical protein